MSLVEIDRAAATPLTAQIYARLRALILAGTLPSGTRMISSRGLAADLGVSRNIVLDAFDQLLAEGYVDTRVGAGTFVASGATFSPRTMPRPPAVRMAGYRPFQPGIADFRSGLPDLTLFPVRVWQKLSREVWGGCTPLDLMYGQPEGRPELRRQIALYVAAHRGVRCHPDQVLVTAGTTQAVGIVSRLLLRGAGMRGAGMRGTRTTCILEDPVTVDIQKIAQGHGARILPVRVDDRGMDVEALPPRARPVFIYVTPSHQFPLGGTMPIQRRARLLDYARARGAFVVEDDYDSEFRYESPPVSSIQGLDPEHVVYIGTFSKTLCPALRIGYIVFPPELVNRGREVKWFSDLHNSSVEQLVLARFIGEGHFVRHVHAMKKAHRLRRQVLVSALTRHFGERVQVLGSAAGLHLCARFRGVSFTRELLARIEASGARVYPVEDHAIRKGRWLDTLILGYGMLTTRRINDGIATLRRCLESPGR